MFRSADFYSQPEHEGQISEGCDCYVREGLTDEPIPVMCKLYHVKPYLTKWCTTQG